MTTPTLSRNDAFSVRHWRPFPKNTLLGFVSLELPSGLVINDITLHEKNGSRWVSMPAKEYTTKDGERSWVPIIEFADPATREIFQELALAAIGIYPEPAA